jgi:CRP-like cAMP-binding protein
VTQINLFKHSKEAFAVEAGHVLFREGEAGDVMFVVLEGGVDVRHGDAFIETIGPGGI